MQPHLDINGEKDENDTQTLFDDVLMHFKKLLWKNDDYYKTTTHCSVSSQSAAKNTTEKKSCTKRWTSHKGIISAYIKCTLLLA